MKYKAFKRVDGYFSITDQDTGQTLDLIIPENVQLQICKVLHDVYYQGLEDGREEGVAVGREAAENRL